MAEKVQFTNSQMLKWMEYVADMQGVSAEKIKMLNTCSKRRNVLATIATHKRVLIFADSTYPNMLYKCWEAGYGDYEMYFGEGYEPSEMKHCKVSDMMDGNLEGPTVIYIVNENTRESMIFGMKNDNFSSGMVKYVGHEIRAVIMNKLEMDVRDTVLLANAESIAVEASMVAYEGVVIAAERDAGSLRTMEENASKFGTHNIEIIPEITVEALEKLPTPRLAFIVAQKSTIENDIVTLLKDDLKFAYRDSIFKEDKSYIIISAMLKLEYKDKSEILEIMESRKQRRLESQPLEYPSAGSVFRNPDAAPSGKLIEDAGLKGYTIGGAKVSEKHANFIINYNNATSEDIKKLIDFVRSKVKEKYNIELKSEQELINWE